MKTFFFFLRRYRLGLVVLTVGALVLVWHERRKVRLASEGETSTVALAKSHLRYDKTVRQTALQVVVSRYLLGRGKYSVAYKPEVGASMTYTAFNDLPRCPKEPCDAHWALVEERIEVIGAARMIMEDSYPEERTSLAYRCADRIVMTNVALVQQTSRAIRDHLENGTPLSVLPDPAAIAIVEGDLALSSYCVKFSP